MLHSYWIMQKRGRNNSVRLSVTYIYQNPFISFCLKFWHKLGLQECRKVTEPDFWVKLHFGPFRLKRGQEWLKMIPVSRYFIITVGQNLWKNVLFVVTNQIARLFGEKRSLPIRSLDFEIAISREPPGRFFLFFCSVSGFLGGETRKKNVGSKEFLGVILDQMCQKWAFLPVSSLFFRFFA